MPILKGRIVEGSDVYTDGWKAYDGLVTNVFRHHRKSGQSRVLSLFERVRSRINTHSEGLICPVLRFVTFSRPHAESWAETLSTGRALDLPVGFLGDGGGCAAGVGRHEGRPSKVGFGGRR
jgi:hypothetical protein